MTRRRSDCVDGPRPCQWEQCRFRIDPVAPADGFAIPSPHCSLDVADVVAQGEEAPQFEQIAKWFGLTRQRIQQIEADAFEKLVYGAKALRLPVIESARSVGDSLEDKLYVFLRHSDGTTVAQCAESFGLGKKAIRDALLRLAQDGRVEGRGPRPLRWFSLSGPDRAAIPSNRPNRKRRSVAA